MANPKKRHSKCRRDKRRTHDSLTPTNYSKCPNCGEPVLSHRMCPNCKTYKGRKVVTEKAPENS